MTEPIQKQGPDILADILADTSDGRIRGLDELNKLIHVMEGNESLTKPVNPVQRKKKKRTVKVRTVKKRTAKHKSTHYLTKEVFDNLGEAKKIIKDLLPDGDKVRATKSGIVESAVKVLLDEFERKGEDSYLVKELLKKKK